MIDIFFDDVKVQGLDSELFVLWLTEVIKCEGFECGDLNLIFVADEKLLGMNMQFLEHDYYTDIITFDYNESNIVSGDFIISIDRVKENALIHKCTFHIELYRVIIHGVLHLLGFSDKTEIKQKKMRELENRYLAQYSEYQQQTNK
jgi:rRNA maturation RNase YbeY